MDIQARLASSMGRRDETPNIALAKELSESRDVHSIRQLVTLATGTDKALASDAIKVLYEIAAIHADLVAAYTRQVLELLKSGNNRMVWGAMTVIHALAATRPSEIFEALPLLAETAEQGSVITRDHYTGILVELAQHTAYEEDCKTLLLEHVLRSAPNQFPTYAEKAAALKGVEYRKQLLRILKQREEHMEDGNKRKRVRILIKKMSA